MTIIEAAGIAPGGLEADVDAKLWPCTTMTHEDLEELRQLFLDFRPGDDQAERMRAGGIVICNELKAFHDRLCAGRQLTGEPCR